MLGLIPILIITAACSSPRTSHPEPARTVSTTRPPGMHEFVSKRYHFRVSLPKDWSGVDAQAVWDGKELQGTDSPFFADFTEFASDRVFTIGALPVAKGMSLAAWRAATVRATNPACADPRSAKRVVLGGEAAMAWTAVCGTDTRPVKFAVVHGARGYIGIFEAGPRTSAADRRALDSILQSLRFTN